MRKSLSKYLSLILGVVIIAIAFDLFIHPLKIVIGGTSGLAVIANELFNVKITTFIEIFYIAALLLNLIVLGIKGTKNVVIGSILYPIFIRLFENIPSYIEIDYTNKLLIFLVSSVLIGIGNGLIYKNDFICGGSDVIKKIINEKLKIPMGKAVFIIDAIIVVSGGFIFGIESILYAIIILYISSKITDKVILGISTKKMFYIMTSKPDEVRSMITKELNCGVTEINAIGGYSSEKNHILMTVISTRDYIKLETRVNEIDSCAFFLITDLYHVYHGKVKYGINKN